MRVLGVDYGTKWTGLAVGINTSCDPLQVPGGWCSIQKKCVVQVRKGECTAKAERRRIQVDRP